MNKIRIFVEPVSNNIYDDSTQNFIWRLQEYSKGRFTDGVEAWRDASNWENPLGSEYNQALWWETYHKFSGYCATKEEGILKAKEAVKEYCRQRKEYDEKKEYIRTNTYVEEVSCLDLK